MSETKGEGSAVGNISMGFTVARKKFLTFFLGVILIGIIEAIAFTVVFVPLGLSIAFSERIAANFIETMAASRSIAVLFAWAIGIVCFALLGIGIGPVFGITTELLETPDTTVERITYYFKKHFGSFLLAGAVVGLIGVAIPGTIFGYIMAWLIEVGRWQNNLGVQLLVTIPWAIIGFLLIAPLMLLFPAVIDGTPVLEATSDSFRLVKDNFTKIYAPQALLLVIIFLVTLPIILVPIYAEPLVVYVIPIYGFLYAVIFLVLLLGAYTYTVTRIYAGLKGKQIVDVF